MKNFKAIAGVTAIFVLGIMIGVLGTRMVVKHRIEKFHKKGPPHVKSMFMKRINKRLGLSPAQKESVSKILDELQTDLHSIRQNVDPLIKNSIHASFKDIRKELTESQKIEFDLFVKELPERFPYRMKHRHKGFKKRNKTKENNFGHNQ